MGRIIGLDYGTVRIGVATSDERQIVATPLATIQNKSDFLKQLEEILKPLGVIDQIVVGLPLKLSGQDSPMTEEVRRFAKALEEKLNLPIELWDERLTSALVEKSLLETGVRRKERAQLSDTLAATVMLQSYLDRRETLLS